MCDKPPLVGFTHLSVKIRAGSEPVRETAFTTQYGEHIVGHRRGLGNAPE